MPVKWTPDNDQLLLLKILETHDISVDAKKISAAWPAGKGEIPTARAITERLVKIRQLARANGAGHFGISSSQAKTASGRTGAPRPQNTTPRHKSSVQHGNQVTIIEDDDEPSSPPKRKYSETPFKVESVEMDGFQSFGHSFSSPRHFTLSDSPTPSPANGRAITRLPTPQETPTKRARHLDPFTTPAPESRARAASTAHRSFQPARAQPYFGDDDDAV